MIHPKRTYGFPTETVRTQLQMTVLEDRLAPALTFQFDYSRDTLGFFNDPARRESLERAADELESRISTTLDAITPTGRNTWQAIFTNPATGSEDRIANLSVPEGTVLVFVGGTGAGGAEAGEGGPGGYAVSGASAWQRTIATRGHSGFAPWGGSISFDSTQNWYFGASESPIPGGLLDFQSIAVHELTHVLGFGTSTQFDAFAGGAGFTGSITTAAYGSNPPLAADHAHWRQGTHSNGEPVSMQPTMEANRRVHPSAVDLAVLQDIGWDVGTGFSGGTATSPGVLPIQVTPTPPVTAVPPVVSSSTPNSAASGPKAIATDSAPGSLPAALLPSGSLGRITALSGPNDGSVQLFTLTAAGQLTPTRSAFHPFNDFRGPVRTAMTDINSDGVEDLIVGTGPGGGSQVRILNTTTLTDLVTPFSVFESSFTGGVFLTAGDFNRDGRAEIVVTPDQGGGPRVRIYSFTGVTSIVSADFMGIEDANFRGGARTSVGDLTGDGVGDLVVAAGFGGGPRVAVFDGSTVLTPVRTKPVSDFFVFEETLRNGVYVAAGDIDGDARADLAFGAGPGGGPRVLTAGGASIIGGGGAFAVSRPIADFFAGDTSARGGVRVAMKDADNNGVADLITGSGSGTDARVYLGGVQLAGVLNPFPSTGDLDGIYVG